MTYGKSEIVNPIRCCRRRLRRLLPAPGSQAGACVGWAASGVEIEIGDEDGGPARRHDRRGASARPAHAGGHIDAGGFHPTPPGGWHATGDLGTIDEHGRLHLVGRTADVIKSGGYKIHPEEIETALAGTAGGIAVTTLPSDYWGEVIIAVAEAAADWPERAAAAAESLAKFKRPRAYVVLDALPRNAQGKVPRGRVREMLLERYRLVDGPHRAWRGCSPFQRRHTGELARHRA